MRIHNFFLSGSRWTGGLRPGQLGAARVSAMAKLVYSAITSLDGYINDENGNFDWGAPDAELFQFINDQERSFGTYLYGRRMYETMVYWETFDDSESEPYERDFTEIWRAAAKIVFSSTLNHASSVRTTIEPVFDPAALRQLKETSVHDLSLGGANLAGQVIEAGFVDEMHLFITPVTVGGGTPAHPAHLSQLELLGVDHFASGFVHLHYRFIN
jgi:dihydrofolate reductase